MFITKYIFGLYLGMRCKQFFRKRYFNFFLVIWSGGIAFQIWSTPENSFKFLFTKNSTKKIFLNGFYITRLGSMRLGQVHCEYGRNYDIILKLVWPHPNLDSKYIIGIFCLETFLVTYRLKSCKIYRNLLKNLKWKYANHLFSLTNQLFLGPLSLTQYLKVMVNKRRIMKNTLSSNKMFISQIPRKISVWFILEILRC